MGNNGVDSLTFVLTGKRSELVSLFNPTIYLEGEYELCMVNLQAYNSIANVGSHNNVFCYSTASRFMAPAWKEFNIPEGTYDIDDLQEYIESEMQQKEGLGKVFQLHGNINTQKISMKSNVDVNFSVPNSIGTLLGFDKVLYKNKKVTSDKAVDINKVNAIDILCNIVEGSFINGKPSHVLYHFYPAVAPGYKIIEAPQQKIYMPVNTGALSSIIIALVDQYGRPVNFRGEEITLYLRLRKRGTD